MKILADTFSIDISQLQRRVYFVRLEGSDGGIYAGKLIKK